MHFALLGLAVLLAGSQASLSAQEFPHPTIDGVFDEWREEHVVAKDRVGDGEGVFYLKKVHAGATGKSLLMSVEFAGPVNIQNGLESDGRLQMRVIGDRVHDFHQIHPNLIVDFRGRKIWKYYSDRSGESVELSDFNLKFLKTRDPGFAQLPEDQQKVAGPQNKWIFGGWQDLGFVCLPTHTSSRFEIQIQIPFMPTRIEFAGSNRLGFHVERLNPNGFESNASQNRPPQSSFARAEQTDLRIANLNTLRNGLVDSGRGPAIRRLINAAAADIYCFQEEWKEDQFNEGIEQLEFENANTLWEGGCAVLTSLPLERIPVTLDRAVAGLVTLPNEERVAVISVHLKSRGYDGSPEDDLRIRQAEQLVGEIKKMRDGAFGNVAKDAPIVLIGDYNLVGSRTPLDILNHAGLTDVHLTFPNDGSAYTWRGLEPDALFWPGRRDLVSHGPGLQALNGIILDSERLKPWQRKELAGLQEYDSRASDHLMLVADFRLDSVDEK